MCQEWGAIGRLGHHALRGALLGFFEARFRGIWYNVFKCPRRLNLSKEHPECPLSNPNACKEADNPKYCALVREDKTCLREHSKKPKKPKIGKKLERLL
jgi:hypothetical protein